VKIAANTSLIDGRPATKERWAELLMDHPGIYADDGPSPAGNPGPYLHVPNADGQRWHRVYPKFRRTVGVERTSVGWRWVEKRKPRVKPPKTQRVMDGLRYNLLSPRVSTWGMCVDCGKEPARGGGRCVVCWIVNGKRCRPDAVWHRYRRWLQHWADKRGDA
jgi:hypothetical protein